MSNKPAKQNIDTLIVFMIVFETSIMKINVRHTGKVIISEFSFEILDFYSIHNTFNS